VRQTPQYDGPFKPLGWIVNEWAINGIASFQSGSPVNVITNKDNDFDGNSSGDRPDQIGDWYLNPDRARADVIRQWFNTGAFAPNRSGQLGTFGRNVVTGPGFKNIDIGVTRSFRITERNQIQFRGEAFNFLNWVNLQNPDARVSSGLFGVITGAREPRIIQLGLKYTF
jgi:hypothetical protein